MAQVNETKDNLAKHLAIAFCLALLGYIIFFALDKLSRTRKGPWEVTFTTNQSGFPKIIVNHSALRITNVTIVFSEEKVTNGTALVKFSEPSQQLPFGKAIFEDLTYLPGSVAFNFFGHEVELLPRTLYLNKQEHPWANHTTFELKPADKLPPSATKDVRQKKRRSFGR